MGSMSRAPSRSPLSCFHFPGAPFCASTSCRDYSIESLRLAAGSACFSAAALELDVGLGSVSHRSPCCLLPFSPPSFAAMSSLLNDRVYEIDAPSGRSSLR
jgi:hypothetical protein